MQTMPTPYPDINSLLALLQSNIQQTLGDKLVGLYLYGSLVIGDFEPDRSDIDLVAALSSDIDEREFAALQNMHATFVHTHKEWENRIEVCYISVANLQTVKTRTSNVVNISPGEPLNRRDAAKHWLLDWYIVRKKGVPLLGPPSETLIEPISTAEFIQTARESTKEWSVWIQPTDRQGGLAYAVLTLCRALYTCEHGEQVSKKQAATWAQKRFPAWSSLIQTALLWRKSGQNELVDDTTFQETLHFVHFAISECEEAES